MIVAWIFVTSLCCAFSLPVTHSNSDVRVLSKRNVRLDPGNSFDEDSVLEEPLEHGISENEFKGFTLKDLFSPHRIWSLHCEPNCGPSEFFPDISVEGKDDMTDGGDVTLDSTPKDEDIVLHLNGDKDLMRFLQWTTSHLASLRSDNASENYNNPGLNTWIKLNLSGRRELPLYVEEPRYIVIRRDADDLAPHLKSSTDLPFIPPRGRKYIPNLDVLRTRNDLFVPNRGKKKGKKDILKDILKYDDLFFPHRGKKDKLKDIFKYDDLFFPNRGKKFDDSTGELQPATFDHRFYTQLSGNRPLEDCFTHCNDVPSAPAMMVTDQAGNINELVSATLLHLPQVSSSTLDAAATDGHRDAVACGGGAAAVAECQKENDVKINGFDQSVKAQIHQRHQQQQQQPPSKGVAIVRPIQHQQHQQHQQQQQIRQRRLSSSPAAASVETSASSFLPLIWSDQVHRVPQQSYPIRSEQWRDYYF